jgi:hypothetical protein
MAEEPAYIRNLKNYAKERHTSGEDIDASVADLHAESDRGAIILAATSVEDVLEMVIAQKLPGIIGDESARKRLFENDGQIATFSKKIWMAYALGIVDKEYRKKLDIIREIRNACAHCRKPLTMENPHLLAACSEVMSDMISDLKDHIPLTLRNAFPAKLAFVRHYIVSGQKIEGKAAQLAHLDELEGKGVQWGKSSL